MDEFEKAVEKIEEKLNIKYFHWTDEKWKKREAFIEQILKLDFFVKVAILKTYYKSRGGTKASRG